MHCIGEFLPTPNIMRDRHTNPAKHNGRNGGKHGLMGSGVVPRKENIKNVEISLRGVNIFDIDLWNK